MQSLFLVFVLICFTQCVTSDYTASVVEYHFIDSKNLSETENLMKNVEEYVSIIKSLKNKTQIVVFPETGFMAQALPRVEIEVPEPNWSDTAFKDKILNMISEAAKDSKLYVVINVREKFKTKHYNTNVVFRSNGTLAAKYRKYNLFNERHMDKPEKPDSVTFTTDFGVEFGIFTCFDILFKSPALDSFNMGIKNFVFPTHWFSELPYLTAIQYQWSWSWRNNVNLLAAGMNNIVTGSSGSGIYNMRQPLSTSDYVLLTQSQTRIITKTVKTNFESSSEQGNKLSDENKQVDEKEHASNVKPGLLLMQEDMKEFTTKPLLPGENCLDVAVPKKSQNNEFISKCNISETICNHDLCCYFEISVDFHFCDVNSCKDFGSVFVNSSLEDLFFKFGHHLSAFSGKRDFGGAAKGGIQVCSIIPCLNGDPDSCGRVPRPEVVKPPVYSLLQGDYFMIGMSFSSISIRGNLITNNSFTTPNILLMDPEAERFGSLANLKNISLVVDDKMSELTFYGSNLTVGTVGLFSRVFDWDELPPPPSKGGAISNYTSQIAFAVVAVIVIKLILSE